jgi:hypothetical protein
MPPNGRWRHIRHPELPLQGCAGLHVSFISDVGRAFPQTSRRHQTSPSEPWGIANMWDIVGLIQRNLM